MLRSACSVHDPDTVWAGGYIAALKQPMSFPRASCPCGDGAAGSFYCIEKWDQAMSQARGLRIRQHERCEIGLPVQFLICDEHSSQVRFSSVSSAVDEGVLHGTSIDVSSGGLALASRQFIPRRCEGIVRVFEPVPAETLNDAMPTVPPVFEQRAKVSRTRMLSHEPLYKIGLSFLDFGPDLEQKIAVLLELAARMIEKAPAPRGTINE